MTRPLRINIPGGWYHVTARGQNREAIYYDKRDRTEFLDRVEEMVKRYAVEIHAYVLMANHYHLLIRTPHANLSRALQWLNNGYGIWWNKRHHRVGHVFQGRFKSVLVEEAAWLLELSLYIHYNPVAVKRLGWGKRDKRVEGQGLRRPTAEVARKRLETLRSYRWSSYRAYAGYEAPPVWLSQSAVLNRVGGECAGYRREAEKRLRQGHEEDLWSRLRWGTILGSERFAERARQGVKVVRETRGRRQLRRRVSWLEIVGAVERVKGEKWGAFSERHGDWGRDMALCVARRRGGLMLRELGELAGGMDYSAVSEAVRLFERRRVERPDIQRAWKQCAEILNLET